jgi:hypothetical protein
VEGDFLILRAGKFFGQVWQIAFKTTTCGKISIQLPCGTKGKQSAPFDNDGVLLQHQETKGD